MATPPTLSPPPKFQSQTNPIIGPQTPDEWAQFWRWLYAQYVTVTYLVGSDVPPTTFPSFPQQQADPGDIIALISGFKTASSALRETPQIPQGFPSAPYNTRQPIEIIVCTQATFPTLTSGSIPVFVFVTDYVHMLYWNGTTSVFCGDQSGLIHWAQSDPGTGYQLCDGSTVNRLNADGTVTSVTVPDATTAWAMFGGLANSGPTAAVAATISGTSGAGSAHSHGVGSLINNTIDPTPTAAVLVVSAGAHEVAAQSHYHDAPAITGSTANESAHTHGVGSFVNSTTGEPRKLVRRPYYRR